jgi:hypoxanthine phosphoribosyltransferase
VTYAPRFAHASEAELARILDYYGVRWEYEPRTFPILWNLDGKVVESFSPDFYLPDLDLYVELTTLKQTLVRKKNRKLRRLRELYPDIRVKLFYGKDFRALMLKYGRFDLAASLSGLEGQLTPDRVPGPASPAAAAAAALVVVTDGDGELPGAATPRMEDRSADDIEHGELVAARMEPSTATPYRGPFAGLRRRLSRGSRRRRGRRVFLRLGR